MGELRHEKWAGTTYGTGWMHTWLIRLLRVTDVRVIYAVTDIFVLPPTLIFPVTVVVSRITSHARVSVLANGELPDMYGAITGRSQGW